MKEGIFQQTQKLVPLKPEGYSGYLRTGSQIILEDTRLDLSVLIGEERSMLRTPTNGDFTMVLRYREKEGAVTSIGVESSDLRVLQVQGARSPVSYKVSTGMRWELLFADKSVELVAQPDSLYTRLTMPKLDLIEGLYDGGGDPAIKRYQSFINRAEMRFSAEEQLFIREGNGRFSINIPFESV